MSRQNFHVDDREFRKNVRDLMARVKRGRRAAVVAAGNVIMTTSKEKAPLDMGDLRGSGYVSDVVDLSDGAAVEIGHGGPAADYAVVQHQDTSLNHEEGESEYLLKAMRQEEGNATTAMLHVMRHAVSGGRPSPQRIHDLTPGDG